MNRRLLAPLGAIALLAAGAGATYAAQPRGAVNTQALSVLRDAARCIRAHGLPAFPDPIVRDDGVPEFPDSAPRVPPSAQQACVPIFDRLPPDYTTTTPVSSADFRKLLRLARSIRAHGIPDWPDPNALGEFPIDSRIQQGGKRLWLDAIHACARLNPDPSGGLHVVRA